MKISIRAACLAVALSLIALSSQAGTLSADLGITKDDGATTSIPGTQITYTITASNAGPNDAANSTVQDLFPATLACTWTCAASAGSSCTANGSGDINDIVTILAGGNVTYTATCDIDPAATGTLSNTATVAADASVSDPDQGNNSATDDNTLEPSADLAISKTDNQTEHTPGTPINYTIVAENLGPSSVGDANVVDTFQAPLQNCSWTSVAAGGASGNSSASGDLGDTLDMPPGSSVTYDVTCDVDASATGSVSNTATIASAAVDDPVPGNDSATDDTNLVPSADLSISKTDNQAEHAPGAPINYTIVAENLGPSSVGDANVVDTFQAPLQNCSWTSVAAGGASGNSSASGDLGDTLDMPPGSSVTYSVTCDVDASATGSVSNTASIASAAVDDPVPGNDSATDDTNLVPSADLAISKTDNQTSHTPGTPINYTIVAENLGPSSVGDANVVDTFQAPLQNCSWTSVAAGGASGNSSASGDLGDTLDMPPGSSVTYDVTCDVDASATGSVDNTATIASASVDDPVPGNDSATDTSSLDASADLAVSKSNSVASVIAGEQVTYTIVVQNNGPSNVDDAVVSDSFPAELENCSWTSTAAGGATGNTDGSGDLGDTLDLPVDASVTYEITCDVVDTASGSVSNTAAVSSASVDDPEPGNDSSTETDTVQVSADLTISKTDNTTEHTPGTPINYVIVVENLGPSAVSDAVVIDDFQAPLEDCSWTSTASGGASGNSSASGDLNDTLDLPVGSSVTYDIVCDVSALATGVLSNTASISSAGSVDPDGGNNSATDGDTVLFEPIPVPTLGAWTLLLLAGVLGLFGFASLRRRLI